jgi:hypothetical protein
MVRAYRESAALMAGVELGLFTRIAQGCDSEAALPDALRLCPLHVERVVTACVRLGLLQRQAGKLENAPDVQRFLVEDEAQYAGEWMLFTKPGWNAWGNLSESLRDQTPPRADNVKVSAFSVDDAHKTIA